MNTTIHSPGRKVPVPAGARIRALLSAVASGWATRPFSAGVRRTLYIQIERGIHAGVPLVTHLGHLAGASTGRRGTELRKMVATLESGGQFYEAAFAARPLFPGPEPALLCASERTGGIPASLAAMAEGLKFEIDIGRRVRRSLAYPVVLVLASAFLIPLPKLITCCAASYLAAAMKALAPFAAVAAVTVAVWLASLDRRVAAVLVALRDNLPWLGKTFRIRALATTLDTLGQALSAGIGLYEALTIARTAASNDVMMRMCDSALASVRDGGGLAAAFGLDGNLPDETAVGIANGERTGNLPEALFDAATALRERYARRILAMVRLLGAAILSAVMVYAALSIIAAFTQVMNLDGGGGFTDEIQREIPGVFNHL